MFKSYFVYFAFQVKVAKKESETQPAGKKKETPVDDSEPSIDEPKENPSQGITRLCCLFQVSSYDALW